MALQVPDGSHASAPPPPPPHNPRDRIVIEHVGTWEVRCFTPGSDFDRYFKAKGFDHLQLWHPPSGVSLLTPSKLTRNEFEIFPFAGWKYSAKNYPALRKTVREVLHLSLPDPYLIDTLIAVFVQPYHPDPHTQQTNAREVQRL